MLIIPLNLDTVLLLLHNSKRGYWVTFALLANHKSLSYFQASFATEMADKDQEDVVVVDE